MKCPRCGADFIWGGDHDYEDYGYEGNGIVSNMSCPTEWCNASVLLLLPESVRLIDIIEKVAKKEDNLAKNTEKSEKSDSSENDEKEKIR